MYSAPEGEGEDEELHFIVISVYSRLATSIGMFEWIFYFAVQFMLSTVVGRQTR